jgi:hypothetical protein
MAVHSSVFVPPFRRSVKGRKTGHNLEESGVKSLHAKETLQLFDILRGWASTNRGSVFGRGGRICHQDGVAQDF